MKWKDYIFNSIALLSLAFLVGCRTTPPNQPTASTITSTSANPTSANVPNPNADAWREDLDFLVERLRTIHPNLFFSISEVEFNQAVGTLQQKLPTLSDEAVVVEFTKIIALVKDAHTLMFPLQAAAGFQIYPLRLYYFDNGLYVVDALPPYEDLIGARVISVGGKNVEDAYDLLAETISHDNQNTINLIIPIRFLIPEMLIVLGIISDAQSPQFVLAFPDGQELRPDLTPIGFPDYRAWIFPDRPDLAALDESFAEITYLSGLPQNPTPLYLSNRDTENYWFTYLESTQTIYFQYNFVFSNTPSGERLPQMVDRIETFSQENEVQRVIVDMRHNPGGNNSTFRSVLEYLETGEQFQESGSLFIIIGRNTFSAAANFVTRVELLTTAIFVGEGTGGSPNLYGDALSIALPNSGLIVKISTRYWQMSTPDDERLALNPDFPVGLLAEDYFNQRDPQLDFILNYAGE